jgi:hypothetical protein
VTPPFVRSVSTLEDALGLRPFPSAVVFDEAGTGSANAYTLAQSAALRSCAVVLVTESLTPRQAAQAARAGLFGCLPRSASPEELQEVLDAAVGWARAHRERLLASDDLVKVGPLLTHARFELKTLDEAERLSRLIAASLPEPERRVGGILELLLNAIEHGNLELDGETKQRSLESGTWFDDVDRLLEDARYADRRVRVTLERDLMGVAITIEDDGPGFDYALLDQVPTPDDGPRLHGRGIALARELCFERLQYFGRGNRVRGWVSR